MNGNSSFWFQTNGPANYVIIDGFVMTMCGMAPLVLRSLPIMLVRAKLRPFRL